VALDDDRLSTWAGLVAVTRLAAWVTTPSFWFPAEYSRFPARIAQLQIIDIANTIIDAHLHFHGALAGELPGHLHVEQSGLTKKKRPEG
jgi:hypothetical protein